MSLTKREDLSDDNDDDNKLISRMALNDHKAGMQGLDKDKINRIIMENTVGSRYYRNEQKRNEQVKERIEKMKLKLDSFTQPEKEAALQKADEIISNVEKERDLSRTIIHVDMDAFYASVEERDQPELKNKPMAVGGMDMLSTSNYVARKYGVRAAMPGFIAMKLCPDLVIVPLNFHKYKEVSKQVQEIYTKYDSNYMAASLDEAYLDVTEHLERRILLSQAERTFAYNDQLQKSDQVKRLSSNSSESRLESCIKSETFGFSREDVAREIRFRIQQKTKLTASAGIAPNTMLAKIASDLNKPNGQALIPFTKEAVLEFMKDLSIRKVSGIGKVSEQILSALDIKKCGDLLDRRAEVVLLFSPVSSSFFLRAGLGSSSNRVFSDCERKSISTERTFNAISNRDELYNKLEELCTALSLDMKKAEVQGKTVTLKIKTVDFELHTRSKSTHRALSTSEDIYGIAKELLKQEIMQYNNNLSLRLMGVGLSKLEPVACTSQSTIKRFFNKTGSSSNSDPSTELRISSTCNEEPTCNSKTSALPLVFEHETTPAECVLVATTSNEVKKNVLQDSGASISEGSTGSSNPNLNRQSIACPVCCEVTFCDLDQLNAHLDICLTSDQKKTEKNRPNSSKNDANELFCPICSVAFDASRVSLVYINKHVDSCLNRKAIEDILKTQSDVISVKSIPNKQGKRRKLNPGTNSKTIDQFFCDR